MKISIIGAGNVGSTTALRLAQEGLGDVLLVDVVKGFACGKAFDLEDARPLLKNNYHISGTDNIDEISGSDIVVITAGLTRKPGMTREELLNKNAAIVKDVSLAIKKSAAQAIVVVVTNPLDLLARFVLKVTGFSPNKVFGMGVSLDTARFANLIAKELNIAPSDVEACVIGPHGEGMLPLPQFSNIKGVKLDEFLDQQKIEALVAKAVGRGLEIVTLLGSGSAYFAPSAAIAAIVRSIAKDEKRTIGVSAYLNGEYSVKDVYIGVPCCIGRQGLEKIIELELNKQEKELFSQAASRLKEQYQQITV